MDILPNLYCFLIIVFNYLISSTYAQDVCVEKSSCECEFSNGTGIDLTPTVTATFYEAYYYNTQKNGTQYTLNTYYFHPCYNKLFIPQEPKKPSVINTCTDPLALCRHVYTMNYVNTTVNNKTLYEMDNGVYDYLGTYNDSKARFSADGKSIIFTNGPSSTIILLNCAQTENELLVYSLEDPEKIVLALYSKDACLKEIDMGRSIGSTLLIIFFSCLIFYLVLGICTKKFLMGATGIEVIPNLAFWTDMPNLVKDGWAFTANGFKLPARGAGPVTTPDPNSYDSI